MAAYNPSIPDMQNRMAWEALIANQYQNGPMPEAPESLSAPTNRLPPLPDGVAWDSSGNGSVNFVNSPNPTAPWFFDPAKNCVQKGSVNYARIALNCQIEQTEDTMGNIEMVGFDVVSSPDPATGNLTYALNVNAPLSPRPHAMPYCIDNPAKAAEWIANQPAAWKKYGPTGRA